MVGLGMVEDFLEILAENVVANGILHRGIADCLEHEGRDGVELHRRAGVLGADEPQDQAGTGGGGGDDQAGDADGRGPSRRLDEGIAAAVQCRPEGMGRAPGGRDIGIQQLEGDQVRRDQRIEIASPRAGDPSGGRLHPLHAQDLTVPQAGAPHRQQPPPHCPPPTIRKHYKCAPLRCCPPRHGNTAHAHACNAATECTEALHMAAPLQ